MNPAPDLNFWWQLMAALALESMAVIGLAPLASRFTRSAVWCRTIWQVCILGLATLVLFEVTGLSHLVASPRNAPFRMPSAATAGAPAFLPASPALRPLNADRNVGAPSAEHPSTAGAPAFVPANPALRSLNADRNVGAPTIAGHPPSRQPATGSGVWWPGLIWLIGAGLVLGRVALAWSLSLVFRRRCQPVSDLQVQGRVQELARQLGISRRIRLIESGQLSSPLTFGVITPTIGLPARFDSQFNHAQQEAILAHELAHLAARDPAWHFLADLVSAAGWWNPLVWWARRQLHAAGETAADEASLLVANGPIVLAECLLAIGAQLAQRRAFGWLGVEGTGFRSGLGRRVERLVQLAGHAWCPPSRIRSAVVKTFGLAVLVTAGILCSAWAVPRALITKGDMNPSWKSSLAAFALAAIVGHENNLAPSAAPLPSQNTNNPSDISQTAPASVHKIFTEEQLGRIIARELLAHKLGFSQFTVNLADNPSEKAQVIIQDLYAWRARNGGIDKKPVHGNLTITPDSRLYAVTSWKPPIHLSWATITNNTTVSPAVKARIAAREIEYEAQNKLLWFVKGDGDLAELAFIVRTDQSPELSNYLKDEVISGSIVPENFGLTFSPSPGEVLYKYGLKYYEPRRTVPSRTLPENRPASTEKDVKHR